MKKLLRTKVLKMYEEDEELLEDVITENGQAMDMSDVYSKNLNGLMDAFASIISNNQNKVMKFLTSITLILAVPTMISSFYGMNVSLPLQHSSYGFIAVVLFSLISSMAAVYTLIKMNMF
jgi:magnesium transporter